MQVSTDKLIKDLRDVVVHTEDLIKATAGQAGEQIEKVRARAEESLRNARTRVQAASHDVQAVAQEGMDKVDSQAQIHGPRSASPPPSASWWGSCSAASERHGLGS